MKIASYKLEYGLFYPKSVHSYVHERVAALGRRVQRQLGAGYRIETNSSPHSEASYMRILNWKTGVSYTTSFRNHGTFHVKSDRVIRLDRHETWKECRAVFLEKLLPSILNKMDTDLVLKAEFERELRKVLDELERAVLV